MCPWPITYTRCEILQCDRELLLDQQYRHAAAASSRRKPRDQLHDHRRQSLGRLVDDDQSRIAHHRARSVSICCSPPDSTPASVVGALPQPRKQLVHVVEGPAPGRPRALTPSCRFSSTVNVGRCRGSPAHSRGRGARSRRSCSRIKSAPRTHGPVASTSPMIALAVVDRPTPLRPSRLTISPVADRQARRRAGHGSCRSRRAGSRRSASAAAPAVAAEVGLAAPRALARISRRRAACDHLRRRRAPRCGPPGRRRRPCRARPSPGAALGHFADQLDRLAALGCGSCPRSARRAGSPRRRRRS